MQAVQVALARPQAPFFYTAARTSQRVWGVRSIMQGRASVCSYFGIYNLYDGGQSGSPVRREGLENPGQRLGELFTKRFLQEALMVLHGGDVAFLEGRGSLL